MIAILGIGLMILIVGFLLGEAAQGYAYERGYDEGIEDVLKMLPEELLEALAKEE